MAARHARLVYALGLWHSSQDAADEPPVPAWVKAVVGVSLLPGVLFAWLAVTGFGAALNAD